MSLSYNEVPTVDNHSWINIHAYVLIDWEKVSLLLSLERLTKGSIAYHFTRTTMKAMERDGGLNVQYIKNKLLYFGFEGVNNQRSPSQLPSSYRC
jgi:hypothetical protein